jgi:hypothetical protein
LFCISSRFVEPKHRQGIVKRKVIESKRITLILTLYGLFKIKTTETIGKPRIRNKNSKQRKKKYDKNRKALAKAQKSGRAIKKQIKKPFIYQITKKKHLTYIPVPEIDNSSQQEQEFMAFIHLSQFNYLKKETINRIADIYTEIYSRPANPQLKRESNYPIHVHQDDLRSIIEFENEDDKRMVIYRPLPVYTYSTKVGGKSDCWRSIFVGPGTKYGPNPYYRIARFEDMPKGDAIMEVSDLMVILMPGIEELESIIETRKPLYYRDDYNYNLYYVNDDTLHLELAINKGEYTLRAVLSFLLNIGIDEE